MRQHVSILIFLLFVYTLPVVCQPKRICVMGSSSAYGYFPGTSIPRDSAWAFKIKEHFKAAGVIDTLYNIGTPGIDCYIGMPTGYVPPPGRNLPNAEFNITRAVNFVPAPDVIIINFPSNNYTVLSIQEILFCLQTMKDHANARNIRCYISTSQPRNDFVQFSERQKLRDIKDSIMARFGVFAIDFYSDIVQEPALTIRPEYNLGDGVHLTPTGHTVLKNKVIERDIFFAPVALNNGSLSAADRGDHVLLRWNAATSTSHMPYRLERAGTNGRFNAIHSFSVHDLPGGQMFFADEYASPGMNFYRISGEDAEGNTFHSAIVRVKFEGGASPAPYLFPTVTSSHFNLVLPPGFKTTVVMSDGAGRWIRKMNFSEVSTRRNEAIDVSHLAAGLYRLHFPGTKYSALTFMVSRN